MKCLYHIIKRNEEILPNVAPIIQADINNVQHAPPAPQQIFAPIAHNFIPGIIESDIVVV